MQKTTYPSYDKFLFEETAGFKERYEGLLKWHEEILDGLNEKTLQSIIRDYYHGKDRSRKRKESQYEIRSNTDFYAFVICPRFALNLCQKLNQKCDALVSRMDFFHEEEEVSTILENYEAYKMKKSADRPEENEELQEMEDILVDQVLRMFGIPRSQTFTNKLAAKGYQYNAKLKQLEAIHQEIDPAPYCLKVLNYLFNESYSIKTSINRKDRIMTFRGGDADFHTIGRLLKLIFQDDVFDIDIGLDYMNFFYRPTVYKFDDKRHFFVPVIIKYILFENRNLQEIEDFYTTRKNAIVKK